MRHYIEHHVVGLVHAVVSEAAKVTDRAVDVAFRESIGGVDHHAVAGELGTYKSAVETGTHLEGAARLGAVAHHAGKGVDHVL